MGAKQSESIGAIVSANTPMIAWRIITLAWAAEIFFLSTGSFRSSASESLLALTLAALNLNVSLDTVDILNTILRKLAHVSQYSVLTLLIYRSFGSWNRWERRRAIWSILIAAIYALTDEFHQRFVVGRGPSLFDCGIDTIGAAIAMLLVHLHVQTQIKFAHVSARPSGRTP